MGFIFLFLLNPQAPWMETLSRRVFLLSPCLETPQVLAKRRRGGREGGRERESEKERERDREKERERE